MLKAKKTVTRSRKLTSESILKLLLILTLSCLLWFTFIWALRRIFTFIPAYGMVLSGLILILGLPAMYLLHQYEHWLLWILVWSINVWSSFLLLKPFRLENGLVTLSQASILAKHLDSLNVQMANDKPLTPDYVPYYKNLQLNWFKKRLLAFKQAFLSSSLPVWQPLSFINCLQQYLTTYKDLITNRDEYLVKISPEANTKVVIIGELQGAFISLVEDCLALKKQGLLEENWTLAKDCAYLLINGDAIDRSPFQLETLTVILRLIQANPKKVFYLKGNHENNDYWRDFGLKEELIYRLGIDSGLEITDMELKKTQLDTVPFAQQLNQLFSTLPMAVYLGVPDGKKASFVRLSGFSPSRHVMFTVENQALILNALAAQDQELFTLHKILTASPASQNTAVLLSAVIHNEKKRENYQDMDGLRFLPPENGIPAWTLLSCPTEVYQKGIRFYYDAFLILQISDDIKNWTITLHKQDVRNRGKWEQTSSNLLSGQKNEPSLDKTEKTV